MSHKEEADWILGQLVAQLSRCARGEMEGEKSHLRRRMKEWPPVGLDVFHGVKGHD